MIKNINIFFLFLCLLPFGVRAELLPDSGKFAIDTLKAERKIKVFSGQLAHIQDSVKLKPFKPDPMKSVWMGAIIPGYGQILNKKYWKLPIVYGGFLGCIYAITWNNGKYTTYKNAYQDILEYQSNPYYQADVNKNPNIATFIQIVPGGGGFESINKFYGGITTFSNTLKSKQDVFRRSQDLSIILTIGMYALTLVDAYVDAQLYDFDISPNLSMHLQPTLLDNSFGVKNTLGMQCCINLK